MSKNDFDGVVRLLRKIIKYTFIIEFIGAIVLSLKFIPKMGIKAGVFNGMFHSVSAFCNAGVDILKGNSFEEYMLDKTINITLMFLIQIGGLGFLVWDDISNCVNEVFKKKLNMVRAIKKLSLHTKIVIITQIIFVFTGMFAFLLFENNNLNTIGNLSLSDKLLVSAFQSISARTAGIVTINVSYLNNTTKLLMLILMFVGGAPGSMAGGIKTVTIVVILFGMIAMLKGKKNITLLRRTIPKETYEKAMEIFIFMIMVTFVAIIAIECCLSSEVSIFDLTFDVSSAITTVGLSVGVLENLNTVGLCVIMLLMYIGRVGTITTAVAFMIEKPRENDAIVYAKEDVIVG